MKKFSTGRAREPNKKRTQKEDRAFGDPPGQTIACLSGFLLNMVKRSIKLISPCGADERWPLGYYIYDEYTFKDAEDLRIVMQKMIEDHMPITVRLNKRIRFRRDLGYESLPDGFRVTAQYGKQTFNKNPFFQELGELINNGGRTAKEITQYFVNQYNIDSSISLGWMDFLLENGVLDEEPKPGEVVENEQKISSGSLCRHSICSRAPASTWC